MSAELNPEALEAAACELEIPCASCEIGNDPNPCRFCESTAERIIRAYLAALPAPRTINGEQVNRAGWTCYGIHEPGNYATCEECREACDDLANFYNNMHHNPVSTKTWTGQPEE